MKVDTKQKKKARKGFAQVYGDKELVATMIHVLQVGVAPMVRGLQ